MEWESLIVRMYDPKQPSSIIRRSYNGSGWVELSDGGRFVASHTAVCFRLVVFPFNSSLKAHVRLLLSVSL